MVFLSSAIIVKVWPLLLRLIAGSPVPSLQLKPLEDLRGHFSIKAAHMSGQPRDLIDRKIRLGQPRRATKCKILQPSS